jgi:uncharacterized phiE125 gp8 family phage protein
MPSLKFISKDQFTAVPIDTMKNYLRIDDDLTQDDELIEGMIKSAVEKIENYCNILLRACEVDVLFNDIDIDDGEVMLPLIPFSQILKVYLIDKGEETEQTDYIQSGLNQVDVKVSTWMEGQQIKVRYIAGYGIENLGFETEAIPDIVFQALNKVVANWYENRDTEGILPGEVRRMLNSISYKSWI